MFPWRSTMLAAGRLRRGPPCLPGGRAPGPPRTTRAVRAYAAVAVRAYAAVAVRAYAAVAVRAHAAVAGHVFPRGPGTSLLLMPTASWRDLFRAGGGRRDRACRREAGASPGR